MYYDDTGRHIRPVNVRRSMNTRSNSAFKNILITDRTSRYWAAPCIIVLLIFTLVACRQFTPPEPNAVGSSISQTNYLLLDWPEGLRVLLWDDIYEGEHHNHTESATDDPVFHQSGSAQSSDGRSYEYALETRDGQKAEFSIDRVPYDLEKGKLFLIHTAGGSTQVEQLDLDLSGLSPTYAGVEEFGWQTTEIARFMQLATKAFAKENCSPVSGEAQPLPKSAPPADPLPLSLKGYVIHSYCRDGQWHFTLTVGRNSVYPCDSSEPTAIDNGLSRTLKGAEALKEALAELPPGELVTWCSPDLPDMRLIDDILAYSLQLGLELYVQTELKPSPTATALGPLPADPTPTTDPDRRPDSLITTSATMPDNSFWYAFDEFDDAGGSPPYSPNGGLYRLKDGLITHFDIPATIRVLEVSPDGHLYVGAGCGVMRFRDESWETLLDSDCSQRTSVTKLFPLDIAFAEDDTVWVGGAYSLASYSNGSWTEFDIPAMRVAIAPDDTVWTLGWDGRANSDCCLTHITGSHWLTYTMSTDVPIEPELLGELFD